MKSLRSVKSWTESHDDVWLDCIRIYIGFALIAKGVMFIGHGSTLVASMNQANIGWGSGLIAHYVILAHVIGGFLLAVGLLTRGAAAANIPVLAGAAFLVHAREGLFAATQALELTLLVLFLLLVLSVSGAGRLSVDAYLARYALDREEGDGEGEGTVHAFHRR